jgi:hypothetical protein
LNKDLENLRRNNQTEILKIKSGEDQYSRLEQVEDRISEL